MLFVDIDAIFEFNSVDEYTGEERWDAIGLLDAGIVFVVYVERITADDNDIIRIIQPDMQTERRLCVMSMAISEHLDLAKTPEEREEDIDYSDIPRITDFSRFVRGKPHFDAMREHNRRVEAERARKKALETQNTPD